MVDLPATMQARGELTRQEARIARRDLAWRRLIAFGLVVPLLVFLFFAFLAPIASMLYRSVYDPTVAELVPNTLAALRTWNGEGTPSPEVLTTLAIELKSLQAERAAGRLADALNRRLPGTASVVKASARRISRISDDELQTDGGKQLLDINDKWASTELWQTLRAAGRVYTIDNYLTALDLEQTPDGEIQARSSARIYVPLYIKTLRVALTITLLCILLGYPVAYLLANAPARTANLLIILVLLPFWTSVLVRATAWIALLQASGVVNSVLMSLGITNEPLELLYTEFATVITMTHILLPFMILPLYSVMKGIDPSYMRAALSLGARPLSAFFRVYLPMSVPGLSAGALIVFIIAVGYYIIPALVGGPAGQMISNLIAFHMQRSNNWELAAALGTILLVVILVLYWIYDRLVGIDNLKLN